MAMTAYAGFDTEPYPRRLPAKSFNVVGLCSQQVLDAFSSFCVFFVLLVLLLKRPGNVFDVLIYFNLCAVEALQKRFVYIHNIVALKA